MPPSNHAMLGASSAHRWLACPPSAAWERQFPDTTSEAAEEGTLAHAIAEEHLRQALAGQKIKTSEAHKAHRLYHPVMEDYVGVYVDYILEAYTEAQQTCPDALLLLEQRVDYSDFAPGGFGTSDCILVSDEWLQIFDFKYGKGVPVTAVGNPQLKLYCLGANREFGALFAFKKAKGHIIQPRLDSITQDEYTVSALQEWGAKRVRPLANLAAKGEGEYAAGDHCKFCRAKNVCRAFAEYQLSLNSIRWQEPSHEERCPNELSKEEIAQILDHVDGLVRWAKGIKEWVQGQALNHGEHFPGWKIVAGRSNRIITDEAAALQQLTASGVDPSKCIRLRPLTELEEMVGKKQLAEALGELIVKPEGKPTLAKETDKRPELNTAQSVFTPIEN